MLDNVVLLAEGAAHHAEGLDPLYAAGATFVILMSLLGITFLFSSMTDKDAAQKPLSGTDAKH
ncbi:hypothetical protein ACUH9Y_04360 [Dermabacteraceae bacterium P13115]|nr:hypothetical protein [Dermabacteraceae bacterium TAE3-ERU5]